MENAIKKEQLDLFSDRTSASRFAANQLRLLFSAFTSILFDALRRALHGTPLERATAGTPRLKLLKIDARVTVSVRRLRVAMDSEHPSEAAFARVTHDCQGNHSAPLRLPFQPILRGSLRPRATNCSVTQRLSLLLPPHTRSAEPLPRPPRGPAAELDPNAAASALSSDCVRNPG